MPFGLRGALPEHDVVHAKDIGWGTLSNGDLIMAAERDGFEVLLTGDRNLRYQQNMSGRTLGIVVVSSNSWKVIRDNVSDIAAGLKEAGAGSYLEVSLPRPSLNRRPPPAR